MWRLASAARRIAGRTTSSAVQCRTHTAISHRIAAASVSPTVRRFASRTEPFTAEEQARLQEAMRAFIGESAEEEPAQPRKPALPRPSKTDLAVLVRASPIFELSYSAAGDHCTAIWMLHDHAWFDAHRSDADLLVSNASSLELLTINRQPRQAEAQLQARQAALEMLCSRGAQVDAALTAASPVAAVLDAARQLSRSSARQSPEVLAASAAIAGLNLVQLGPMWSNHSRDAMRLFLRSFVQHVQHGAALQLRTESELEEMAPAASRAPRTLATPPPAARNPHSLLPPLQPSSFVDAASVRVPTLRSPQALLATLPPQSRDERYRAFVRLSLEQMLHALYPDPQTAKDPAESEEFLERRRRYVAQLQWPAHCAEDSEEFSRRFLTPRRIELHVQVHDTVNAYEQQMIVDWFRRPGDFTPAANPRTEGRLIARRRTAGHILDLQKQMLGEVVSPAPFSSLRAASRAALSQDHAELRAEQVAGLFDILCRDQAVLHSVPLFGPPDEARPARRQVHAMFHTRMRAALMKQRMEDAEPASDSTLEARSTNERFLQRFGRGAVAATAPPKAGADSSAAPQPSMHDLVSSLDSETLSQLHDATLLSLSRDLDIPLCAIRETLNQIDLDVRAAYRQELAKIARERGISRRTIGHYWKQKSSEQRMAKLDTQSRRPVFDVEQETDNTENASEEALNDEQDAADEVEEEAAEEDGEEEDLEALEDDEAKIDTTTFESPSVDVAGASPAFAPLSTDEARALHDQIHSALLARDPVYAACDGVFVSLFPLDRSRQQGFLRDLQSLQADVRSAVLHLRKQHLRQGARVALQKEQPLAPLQHFSPSVAASSTTPVRAPRFFHEGRKDAALLRPHPTSAPLLDARAKRSRKLADDFAGVMLSHLSQVVPGGVRITTESWLSQYAGPVWGSPLRISTPDMLMLDDVSIVVHYPRVDDPQRPQARRSTAMVPMRWVEIKNSFGAFLHYRGIIEPAELNPLRPVSDPNQSASELTWTSPTRASIVEQSSRYAALFGPGCVVFGRGFSDAWLRPFWTHDAEGAQPDFPMPEDVNFLDGHALVQVIKAELKGD